MDTPCELVLYVIRDLTREFGLTARTLRVYEEKSLITAHRDPSASSKAPRTYTEASRERLRRILDAKALGLTLAEIKAVLDRPSAATAGLPVSLTHARAEVQFARMKKQTRSIQTALHLQRQFLLTAPS